MVIVWSKRTMTIKKPAELAGMFVTGGGHETEYKALPSLQKPVFQAHFNHSIPSIS